MAWFGSDADCLDYLEWLRWPEGFVCLHCGHSGGWRLGDGRFKCFGCRRGTSVTAGTICPPVITSIDHDTATVQIGLTKDEVKEAPDYVPRSRLDTDHDYRAGVEGYFVPWV